MKSQSTHKAKMVSGYLIEAAPSKFDRLTRLTVGTTGNAVLTLLATYVGLQAAAHEAEATNFAYGVAERMSAGVQNTLDDIRTAIEFIHTHPNFLDTINSDSIPREILDPATRASQHYSELGSNAFWNLMRNPFETIVASLGVSKGIQYIGTLLSKTLIYRDKPDFNQRFRSGFWNTMRRKQRSRKLEIPDLGGNQFQRK